MLNKTIYATIFPYLKNTPGPLGNTSPALRGNGADEVLDQQGRRGPSPAAPADQQQVVQPALAPAQPTQIQNAGQGAQDWMASGVMPAQPAPTQPTQPVPMQPAQPVPPVSPDLAGDPDYQQFQQTGQMPAGYVQSAQGAVAPSRPVAAPAPTKKKKKGYGPEIDPTLSPEEQAKKALQFWQNEQQNPTNQDHGWKGTIKEIIENFLFGLSHTQPGMGWKEGLVLGGIGAAGGAFNRGANEQRRAMAEVPLAERRVQTLQQQSLSDARVANEKNEVLNRNARTRIEMDESVRKQITAEQDNLLKVWEKTPNATRATHPKLFEAADKANLILADKKEDGRFTLQIGPDGRPVVINTSTGEYKVGNENLSKPGQIDEKLLTDDLFGLYDDKTIENMATASTAQGLPSTVFKSEIVGRLPAELRNPDGSFNLEKFSAAKEARDPRVDAIELSQIIGNAPDNYKQRHAKEVEKLRGSQKETRAEVAKFRAALASHRPGPNAKGKPLTTVVDVYKKILALPTKERTARLKEFYDSYLPNIRVE